jgi:hypothetical protein
VLIFLEEADGGVQNSPIHPDLCSFFVIKELKQWYYEYIKLCIYCMVLF